jgi:transposase
VGEITLVFDKGNNSEDNLKRVSQSGVHFIGSLVPTQHPDLLAIPRARMRRLDRSQLPAVWAFRTHKFFFGVNPTVLVTFNQKLFRATNLSREIHKRERKLEKLQQSLGRRYPVSGVKHSYSSMGSFDCRPSIRAIVGKSRPWPG